MKKGKFFIYSQFYFISSRKLVFLYTLIPGVCPKSYGMTVAKMAGIPESIIKRADGAADVKKKLGSKFI
jgi:DNA mismatch repair ATPase MutS